METAEAVEGVRESRKVCRLDLCASDAHLHVHSVAVFSDT